MMPTMEAWLSRVVLPLLLILRTTSSSRYGPGTAGAVGVLPSEARAVRSLPAHLVPCYSDPGLYRRETRLPSTMANLVDLVQRVEKDPDFVADMRVVLTTLLHRFRVDGLERDPLVAASPGVTPFRLTGMQHARHRVLAGRLLSGNANLFPNASLSLQQQCALHFMLSSAVDPWERGDEAWICPRMPTPRRSGVDWRAGTGGSGSRLYPDPVRDVGPWGGVNVSPPPPAVPSAPSWSACPVEEGVVEAGRAGGAVAAGAALAGLAAGLQPQRVPLAALLSPRHLEQLRADGGRDSDSVDNLWAATLAGDLAEVSAYQGPASAGVLAIGPAGEWNDSLIPRVRYLSRQRPGSPEHASVRFWDMTDAEIRGGFDGLALGSRVADWAGAAGRGGSLRLSQVLDMYYSSRGMAFETDVKACRRGAAAANVFATDTLMLQTSRFARTLTDSSRDAPYMTEAALRNFTAASTRAFLRYAGDLLDSDACDVAPLLSSRVNALVVLDTTWVRESALNFITSLAGPEGIDVGLFGSRLAVINGGQGGPPGGRWIVNFTDSPVQLAADLLEVSVADGIWPTFLDLPWTLMAVIEHLQAKAEAESARGGVGSAHGDVVVVLAMASTVSDADMRHSKTLVPRVKQINPDTRILYVVTDIGESRFQELASLNSDWDDAVVVVDDTSPAAVAQTVASYLRDMPGRLVPAECMLAQGRSAAEAARAKLWPVQRGAHVWEAPGVRWRGGRRQAHELQDYVSPGQLRLYRIHTAYLRPGGPVSVQLVGEDYGDLRMCVWRGAAPGGRAAAMSAALQRMRAEADEGADGDAPQTPQAECTNLVGFAEANVTIAEPCGGQCAPLYVSVAASRSNFRCSEDDCRYPDEVRFLLRPRGLLCVNADPITSMASPWPAAPSPSALLCAVGAAALALRLLAST